jgi:integrase
MARPQKVNIHPYETKAGIRYKLRWHAGGRNNEEGGFTNEDDAKIRANEVEGELLRGETPTSNRGNQKLCDFAEFHFRTATWLKPNTVGRYRSLVKLNMNAVLTYPDPLDQRPLEQRRQKMICLGNMPLKKINVEVVEEWVLAVEHLRGESERAKAYRCLSGIMSRALKRNEIHTHPCQVKGASAEEEARRPHVDEDIPFLLAEALRDYTDHYGRHSRDRFAAIPLFVGYGTGNRKSEVRGLRRRDIKLSLTEARIEIERQAYYVDAETGWNEEAPTKSKKGGRTLFIEEVALEALRQHMEKYMRPEEEDPEGNDLVFTSPMGGPISDTTWHNAWTQARSDARALDKRVPPNLHLHDLRHHAATAVAEGTKDLKHIQNFLGDSTPRAALRYLDVTDDHKREIGRKMGERFKKYRLDAPVADVVPIRRATHFSSS